MKKVCLKKIVIDNFEGTKHREIDFGELTEISGRNESGKTTVGNAYGYTMSNRLLDGSSPEGIRPKENGQDVNDIEIGVTVVIEVDGREFEIRKTQVQNWNKKQGILTGNSNSYMINGIPKKDKEFKEFLAEIIAPDEVIQFCTSAAPFLKLDSKKRREKLFSLIPDFSERDVIDAYPDLMPVMEILKDGSVEDLIARCKFQLNGRGRENKGLYGQLDDIPVRIDEATRSIADVEALDAEDSILDSDISFLNDRLESLKAGDVTGLKEKAAELKAKMRAMAQDAFMALREHKAALNMEIRDASTKVDTMKRMVTNLEAELRSENASIERMQQKITAYGDQWLKTKQMVFDERKKTCAYCGQPLPEERVNQLVSTFEAKKADELAEIEKSGNNEKQRIIETRERIKAEENRLAGEKSLLADAEKVLSEKEQAYSAIPSSVSMDDNAEYQGLQAEYDAVMAQIVEPDADAIDAVKHEINAKQARRNEVQSMKLASIKAKERIKSLEQDRRDINQKIALIEQQRDLLMEYNKRRGQLITSRINSLFAYVEWDLFNFTIDGSSYTEICEPKLKGIRHSERLNGGGRILAEADICNTFQKANGVSLPVFLDNAEAITAETRKMFSAFDFQPIFLQAAECDFTVTTE